MAEGKITSGHIERAETVELTKAMHSIASTIYCSVHDPEIERCADAIKVLCRRITTRAEAGEWSRLDEDCGDDEGYAHEVLRP